MQMVAPGNCRGADDPTLAVAVDWRCNKSLDARDDLRTATWRTSQTVGSGGEFASLVSAERRRSALLTYNASSERLM
jgi:hypothetical protein